MPRKAKPRTPETESTVAVAPVGSVGTEYTTIADFSDADLENPRIRVELVSGSAEIGEPEWADGFASVPVIPRAAGDICIRILASEGEGQPHSRKVWVKAQATKKAKAEVSETTEP